MLICLVFEVDILSLKQLNLVRILLHSFFVTSHLFRRVADIILDMVEFLNNRFNLAGKVLDVRHGTIVLVFSVFSRLELLLNFAFNLALEFGFEV